MPISLYSGGNLAGSSSNGNGITLTFPSGLSSGAVVYLCVGARSGYSVATSGYSSIATRTSGSHVVNVYRKILTGSLDTNVVITGSGSQQDAMAAAAFILRGVDNVTPEDVTPTSASASSTNPNNPAITTVTDSAWILAFASSQVFDSSVTPPTNYNDSTGATASDNNSASTYGAWYEKLNAGAENPAAWTNWSTGSWGAITVAVRSGGFPVTGVAATGQVGNVVIWENERQAVTGVVGSGQVGTAVVRARAVVPETGLGATTALGTQQLVTVNRVPVTGQVLTASLGNIQVWVGIQIEVDGVDAQGQVGDAIGISGVIVPVTGVQAAIQVYGPVYFWYGIDDSQTTVWQDILT